MFKVHDAGGAGANMPYERWHLKELCHFVRAAALVAATVRRSGGHQWEQCRKAAMGALETARKRDY
ncbi:MAG: hypothetical protein AB7U75_00185 [Hyphomicrobiaceae bacterium]